MKIITENYKDYRNRIPQKGHHILAHQTEDSLVVYQAFNPKIAKYAVENQVFGGEHYRYTRMSWIKPNYLWMMYRCGWCEKKEQTQVLAIWIKKESFDVILENAAYSSFKKRVYETEENWRNDLAEKKVRLQWDPDHNPLGEKEERRAIQLGMKDEILEQFGKEMILKIENITPFVKEQKRLLDKGRMDELQIPQERIYVPKNKWIQTKLGLSL